MASTPTITSPADNSTQSLPFNLVGTGTINGLVEVRDDAGYLLPATLNPVTVDGAGDWTIAQISSLVGTKTGCKGYAAAGGSVVENAITSPANAATVSQPVVFTGTGTGTIEIWDTAQ